MAKKSWSLVIAVFLAALIGLAFAAAKLKVADNRNPDTADLSALQDQLQSLKAQLAETRGRASGLGLDANPDAFARGASQDNQPKRALTEPRADVSTPAFGRQAPPEDAQSAAERRQREAGIMENVLANEVLDVAATNTFAQNLKESLVRDGYAGTQMINAECRASLCRVAVLHKSDDDMEAFLDSIPAVGGFSDAEAYWQRQPNADGSSSMTLYIARQGHRLPRELPR